VQVSLLKPSKAKSFLEQYKRLLSEITGRQLDGTADYVEARETLYEKGLNKTHRMDPEYDSLFIEAVRHAQYGMFVYGKKYKLGYAFKSKDNLWYCVQALTTPLEDILPDWIVVVTAILPFRDNYVCDGLIVDKQVSIDKNMIHDMIQELKIERSKWLSNKRAQSGQLVPRGL
jgi:hypothetical protein